MIFRYVVVDFNIQMYFYIRKYLQFDREIHSNIMDFSGDGVRHTKY